MSEFKAEFTCRRYHGGTKMGKLTCFRRQQQKDKYPDCQSCLNGKQIKQEIMRIGEAEARELTEQFYTGKIISKIKPTQTVQSNKPLPTPSETLISVAEILQETGITPGRFYYYKYKYNLRPVKKEGGKGRSSYTTYYSRSVLNQIEQARNITRPYSKRKKTVSPHEDIVSKAKQSQGQENDLILGVLVEIKRDISWIKQKLEQIYK